MKFKKEQEAMKFKKGRMLFIILSTVIFVITIFATGVYAASDWGQNTGQWVMDQAWWLALAVVVVISIKFMAKKMWVQFAGFLVLGGLVVFFVKFPDKLLYVGQTIYSIVTGQ